MMEFLDHNVQTTDRTPNQNRNAWQKSAKDSRISIGYAAKLLLNSAKHLSHCSMAGGGLAIGAEESKIQGYRTC